MKLRHLTTLFALVAMLGLTAGCGEEEADTETPSAENAPEEANTEDTAEAAEEPAAEEAQADTADEGGGGTVCERAASCCEAYVGALAANTPGLSVETTCASVRSIAGTPGSDASCQSMIDGWRTGLTTANLDVPGACAAA